MSFKTILGFFNLTGCTWVLQMHKKGSSGGNYLYKCDALQDILSGLRFNNKEGREPTNGWKVTLINKRDRKDYSSILNIPEVYSSDPRYGQAKEIIEKSYGLRLPEEYPVRLRYAWNKSSYEIFVDKRRGKVLDVGLFAPDKNAFPLMDAFEKVYGYKRI